MPEPSSSRWYSPFTSVFSSLRCGSCSKPMRLGSSKVITSVNTEPMFLPSTGTLVTCQVQRSPSTSMRFR